MDYLTFTVIHTMIIISLCGAVYLGKQCFIFIRWMSDGELREKQTANYFSDIYPIDCAVLSANAQSCPKCCMLLSVLLSA